MSGRKAKEGVLCRLIEVVQFPKNGEMVRKANANSDTVNATRTGVFPVLFIDLIPTPKQGSDTW